MNQSTNIHSETPVDSRELRELIARLANSGESDNDHRTRVKDIAETMDVDVERVISALQTLRAQKQTEGEILPVPEKLANSLMEMKTPIQKPVTMAPTRRMIFLSSFFVFMLLLGGFIAVRELVVLPKQAPKSQLASMESVAPRSVSHEGPR